MTNDYEAIRGLCFRYTFMLDDGDFAGVAALLGRGVLRPAMPGVEAEPITGAEEIERFYTEQVITYRDGDPRTRHLITNQLIEIADDGTSATSRCYFTVLQRPPKRPYGIVVGGQYHDRFVKEDGTWRFAEKTIQVDHLNEIELHFRITADRAKA